MGTRVSNLAIKIVEILRDKTDRDHPMTQAQLQRELEQLCGTAPDRGAIRRNLEDLCEDDHFPIRRAGDDMPDDEDFRYENYKTNLYYDHPFTPEEVRFLMDGLMFSRFVPAKERTALINKLSGLAGNHFRHHMGSVGCLSSDEPANPQLFDNIAKLAQAIEEKKMVWLSYNYFGHDKLMHPVLNSLQKPLRYPINPYKIVFRNGFYFLVCNNDWYDDLTHYRIDRMTDIDITDKPCKPLREVYKDAANFDTRSYMEKNINMAFGEPERITFECKREGIPDVIDTFGKNVEITKLPLHFECVVHVPEYDMVSWALAHSKNVMVTAPESLVRELAYRFRKSSGEYDRLLKKMKEK